MKTMQKRLLTILLMTIPFVVAIAQGSGVSEIKIKTSAQCGMCKDAIEETLAFERGVKKSNLDLKTKIVTVEYDARRTNPEKIKKAISRIGYDADEVPADKKAYEKLAPCCKKPEDPNHRPH